MASTPSQNNAFELIGTGEKAGTWGTITNRNLEIIDRKIGSARFNLDQLQVGRDAFMSMLTQSLAQKAAEE